ncbi:hypothetical protein V493_06122 [Pseudogymnoascus sp. VKM F-4281 (FW-2241)]|nr:hypothetical protein V493_06122 [Pseudogymnoascus sp. VKM F-4281 (FW-2241)]
MSYNGGLFTTHNLHGLNSALEFLPSKIHQHGTGLFAKNAIPEGSDVFRSTPLVSCVGDGMHTVICDFCFASSVSKINLEGDFNANGDAMPKIRRCTRCGDCQKKAWEKYHKSECNALKNNPTSSQTTRMLYRVLAMQKQGTLILNSPPPEYHAMHHLQTNRLKHYMFAGMGVICDVSQTAKTLVKSELTNMGIHNLYCQPTSSAVTEADQGGGRNNADVRDAQLRRKKARTDVVVCEKEMKELNTMALEENFSIKDFAATESKLLAFMCEAIGDNNALKPTITVGQIKTNFDLLTSRIFSTRSWPDTLYPMNDMRVFLARIHEKSKTQDQAAIFTLRGFLATARRSGPGWVDALTAILMAFTVLLAPAEAAKPGIPGMGNMLIFVNGILYELLAQARKVYGADMAFTNALGRWQAELWTAVGPLLPGDKGFVENFGTAQVEVMAWAGVDESMAVALSEGECR